MGKLDEEKWLSRKKRKWFGGWDMAQWVAQELRRGRKACGAAPGDTELVPWDGKVFGPVTHRKDR